MDIKLLNDQGQSSATFAAPDTVFGRDFNEALVHQIVIAFKQMHAQVIAHKKLALKFTTQPKSLSVKRVPAALVLV